MVNLKKQKQKEMVVCLNAEPNIMFWLFLIELSFYSATLTKRKEIMEIVPFFAVRGRFWVKVERRRLKHCHLFGCATELRNL